jgi:hypothetical protein
MMVWPEAQQKIVDEPLVHADEPGIWLAAQNSPLPHAGGADAEHAPLTMVWLAGQQKIVEDPLRHADEPGIWLPAQNSPEPQTGVDVALASADTEPDGDR